jgi:hypothetical protein
MGPWPGLTVRLTNVATNQTYDTVAAYGCAGWCSDAFYQFANLPTGQYRLSIPTLPPGHLLASEPVVNYTVAGQSIQQNLTLNPLGHLSGVVYLDDNVNGQRDSGEAAATGYVVSLLNDGGLPVQTATPDANGVYLFTNLSAGVRYLATVDLYVSQAASLSDSLTKRRAGSCRARSRCRRTSASCRGGRITITTRSTAVSPAAARAWPGYASAITAGCRGRAASRATPPGRTWRRPATSTAITSC